MDRLGAEARTLVGGQWLELEPEDVGEIEIRTGEVALVRAAVPWAEAGEDESLVVSLPSARYAVREGRLDEEGFGIDVWRIAG